MHCYLISTAHGFVADLTLICLRLKARGSDVIPRHYGAFSLPLGFSQVRLEAVDNEFLTHILLIMTVNGKKQRRLQK